MLLALLLEITAFAGIMARPVNMVPKELSKAEPAAPDVIYFTADELPRTQDLAGGSAGRHGARGGSSLKHPSQVIKVTRGEKLDSQVADAPALHLPQSESQVANLLAYKAAEPTAPPNPIMVHPDQRPTPEMAATAPHVSLPRDILPSLPESKVIPVAPPTPIQVSHEHAKLELPSATPAPAVPVTRERMPNFPQANTAVKAPPTPIQVARARRNVDSESSVFAPAVTIAREQMPSLPQANIAVKAPPTPIQVARARRKADSESSVSTPTVTMAREQMPDLPQSNTAAKAPPAPIQVFRSQRRTTSDSSTIAAPKINSLTSRSGENQLASLVPAPTPRLPSASPKPTAVAGSKMAAVVVSAHPGPNPGVPKNQEKTTVAMERGGTNNPGAGGAGGGTGMLPGKGSGSSIAGTNAGSGETGNDKSTDLYARNGNSPNLGPGGAGNLSNGTLRTPGVSVSGGRNSITLPSFGGPPPSTNGGHSEIVKNMGTGVTVVASPRAGGALNLYGALKGDRVYTIYINTRLGTAIMQFADPNSVGRAYLTVLTAPRVLRADVAEESEKNGPIPRVLINCHLDEQGIVRNARVLQAESNEFAGKLLAAIPLWKFTPAFRGNQPVAVDAIVGFGVDTK